MKEVRAAVIYYENKKLLDKMMEIERKRSTLNPVEISKHSFQPTKTLNTGKRLNDLRKINSENRSLMYRLQSAHSVYNTDKWVEDDKKHSVLRRNISQNARRVAHMDYSNYGSFGTLPKGGSRMFFGEY